MTSSTPEQEAEKLARLFHETYERLSPEYGYETRPDTKQFDPQSKNGRLMVAVCGEIMNRLIEPGHAVEIKDAPTKADDIEYEWTDCSVCVNCPCGHQMAIDDDEVRTCECGRVYSLGWQVNVRQLTSME